MKKLIVCDVEGTIFEAKYKIDGTDFASTMWQPLAHSLGEKAIIEERETHKKWDKEEYNSYLHWVEDTYEIHKKYKLTRKQFYKLINKAEYIEGVVEFFRKLDRDKYIPVLVSGGFKELILRAQRELQIKHGSGACQYIFDNKTDKLAWCSTTPCDFHGKYDYVHTILNEYKLDHNRDWIFIGDGKNDVDIATKAPFSIGINAHAKLASEVKANVSNFNEIYDIIKYNERKVFYSTVDNTSVKSSSSYKPDLSSIKNELNELYRNYYVEVVENDHRSKQISSYKTLIDKLNIKLEAQENTSKLLENDKNELLNSLRKIEEERDSYVSKVKSLNNNLDSSNKEKQSLKKHIAERNAEINKINAKLNDKAEYEKQLLKSIKENEDRKKIYEENKHVIEREQSNSNKRLSKHDINMEFISDDISNKLEKSVAKIISESVKHVNKQWFIRTFFDADPSGKVPKKLDMMVVSRHCIFVIEAKKYHGCIEADGAVKNTLWNCITPEGNVIKIVSTKYLNPYDQVYQYTDKVTGKVKSLNINLPVIGLIVFPESSNISKIGDILTNHCFVTTEDKLISTMDRIEFNYRKFCRPPEKTMMQLLDM